MVSYINLFYLKIYIKFKKNNKTLKIIIKKNFIDFYLKRKFLYY